MLHVKELEDVTREEFDDEDVELSRMPAIEIPVTGGPPLTGLAIDGTLESFRTSPPLSIKVLRCLGSGSGTLQRQLSELRNGQGTARTPQDLMFE